MCHPFFLAGKLIVQKVNTYSLDDAWNDTGPLSVFLTSNWAPQRISVRGCRTKDAICVYTMLEYKPWWKKVPVYYKLSRSFLFPSLDDPDKLTVKSTLKEVTSPRPPDKDCIWADVLRSINMATRV